MLQRTIKKTGSEFGLSCRLSTFISGLSPELPCLPPAIQLYLQRPNWETECGTVWPCDPTYHETRDVAAGIHAAACRSLCTAKHETACPLPGLRR